MQPSIISTGKTKKNSLSRIVTTNEHQHKHIKKKIYCKKGRRIVRLNWMDKWDTMGSSQEVSLQMGRTIVSLYYSVFHSPQLPIRTQSLPSIFSLWQQTELNDEKNRRREDRKKMKENWKLKWENYFKLKNRKFKRCVWSCSPSPPSPTRPILYSIRVFHGCILFCVSCRCGCCCCWCLHATQPQLQYELDELRTTRW